VTVSPNTRRSQTAAAVAAALLVAALIWFAALVDLTKVGDPLTLFLIALAIAAEVLSVRFERRLNISGTDTCYLVALALIGTGSAIVVAGAALLASYVVERYRTRALLINLAGVFVPILIAGTVFEAISAPHASGDDAFLPGIAIASILALGLNLAIVLPLMALLDGVRVRSLAPALRTMAGALMFQAAFVVASAGIYARFGTEAGIVAVVLVLSYAYMTRLVLVSRERTRQYANLSWGILSGLIRTLDVRDSRAARHCAAVARFSRDIAKAEGLGERDQELAHTAGLLHDIGKFALSDRVMDGSTDLTDEDWQGIRRHPSIGAELLKDIGVYGPVAEIVGAHHERMDGRGYPRRLPGEEIPAIARIVAVAEVYDTLTAPDTYRTPMNSFEALNELRRVAGTQLDGHFVEVLAEVLAGQGTAYRHADEADFDAELDIQRRMNEAAAT
jgi:putative nucleotidyltransferase with HDIG domain